MSILALNLFFGFLFVMALFAIAGFLLPDYEVDGRQGATDDLRQNTVSQKQENKPSGSNQLLVREYRVSQKAITAAGAQVELVREGVKFYGGQLGRIAPESVSGGELRIAANG